jgi:hypothetical protein
MFVVREPSVGRFEILRCVKPAHRRLTKIGEIDFPKVKMILTVQIKPPARAVLE